MSVRTKTLTEDRQRTWEAGKELLDRAAQERRELTKVEQQQFDKVSARLDELDVQIQAEVDTETRQREIGENRGVLDRIGRTRGNGWRDTGMDRDTRDFLDGRTPVYEGDISEAVRWYHEHRDLLEVTAGAGGNLVQTTLANQLYVNLVQLSGLIQAGAFVLSTTSGEPMALPAVNTFGTASLVGEGSALPQNDPTFRQVSLPVYKAGNLLPVSAELINDSSVDIVAFIARDAARIMDRAVGPYWTTGTGSNQPTGYTTVAGTGKVGQTGSTGLPSYSDLVDMTYSIAQPYRRGAAWLAHDTFLAGVRKVVDGQGRPIWEPNVQAGQPDVLLGYPCYSDPDLASMGTAKISAAFGNWTDGMVLRIVNSIRFESSQDFRFDRDEVTFRTVMRTGSNVRDTGAIKLYKGGTA